MQAYHGLRAWRQLRQQLPDVGALEPPRPGRGRREPDEIDKISPVASPAATGLDAGDESGTSSPWRKSPLHSSGDASRLTALFGRTACSPRLRMPNMRPPHALSDGRLAALGATRGFHHGLPGDKSDIERPGVRITTKPKSSPTPCGRLLSRATTSRQTSSRPAWLRFGPGFRECGPRSRTSKLAHPVDGRDRDRGGSVGFQNSTIPRRVGRAGCLWRRTLWRGHDRSGMQLSRRARGFSQPSGHSSRRLQSTRKRGWSTSGRAPRLA